MSGTIENNLRFPGQYFDSETGLYYNWHRYYRAEVGRYMRGDPSLLPDGNIAVPFMLFLFIREPYNMNPYVYTEGNPIMFRDKKGCAVFPPDYYKFPPTGGWPPDDKCLKCDWLKVSQCIAEAYDQEQIEACKTVCECPRIECRILCAICLIGKTYEVVNCFIENCEFTECCK